MRTTVRGYTLHLPDVTLCPGPGADNAAMNLAHLLQRKALEDPDRPAIYHGTQPVATHGQWADRAARVCAHMRAAGLQPGERVVLFMHNHPRYLEQIARFKRLKRYEFVEALPKNNYGKVLKTLLRERI